MESCIEPPEGEILDKTYRLVRLVAEGGMGLVYEATHARLAGRYAIKVLPPQWSKDPAAMARFDREARITSSLQHPNIVQIIDFNTAADGTEYLVMEYLQGETIAARLARLGPLPLDAVVTIVEQVASGLAAAHAHGIVHRDLKPENVLLMQVEGREGDWAKILDFGISKVTGTNVDTIGPGSESLIGTPLYMAPEQCQGQTKDVGPATDQFALAVITYEMLTGRPPFADESIGDVLFRVLHAEPPPMNIDRGVESVVRRGLAKSSRNRYPSVTAFAEALRAAVLARGQRLAEAGDWREESGSHAYEIENTTFASPSRHNRWAAGLAAAAALTVATVFVARTVAARRLTPPDLASGDRFAPALVVPTTAAATRPPVPSAVPEIEPMNEPPFSAPVDPGAPDLPRETRDEGAVAAEAAGDAKPTPPARAVGLRAPVTSGARTSATRTVTAVAWTSAQRGSSARAPIARPATAAPARAPTIGAPAWVPPARPPTQAVPLQPPPFKPLPADGDDVLPLTEGFNDRP